MVHPLQTYLQIRRARPVIYSEDFSLPFCHSAKRMARQPRGVISWLQKVESTGAGGWSLNAENNPKLVVNSPQTPSEFKTISDDIGI